jgi:mRNA interferase MazF
MNQREIWYANLNPVKGSEQQGYRPVVIISGNVVNKYLKIVIVCPLTTKVKNYKGNVVLEPNAENGLSQISEVLIFHVRSVSKERLIKKIGTIKQTELDTLKKGLDDILTY